MLTQALSRSFGPRCRGLCAPCRHIVSRRLRRRRISLRAYSRVATLIKSINTGTVTVLRHRKAYPRRFRNAICHQISHVERVSQSSEHPPRDSRRPGFSANGSGSERNTSFSPGAFHMWVTGLRSDAPYLRKHEDITHVATCDHELRNDRFECQCILA